MGMHVALAGPPNCGKTTLFNGLTGGSGKVANHAGVTVETAIGSYRTSWGVPVTLLDLPGIHGLTSRSADARVAVDVISGKTQDRPDVVIVVVDAGNLRTHLQTALQIFGLGTPAILALNMVDLAERDGVRIDIPALATCLGVPVVPVRATRQSGRAALIAVLDEVIGDSDRSPTTCGAADPRQAQIAARRIASDVIQSEPAMHRLTRQIDAFALHPLAGPLLFLGLLFTMFQAVFSWSAPFMDAIETGVGWLAAGVATTLPDGFVRDFLTDGVIAGVGAVIVFLPQILILFAFILILEGTGYLARAAFLADEFMRHIGLSGQAVIPLLSSFACAIPGIMATRTIPDHTTRLVTILIAPLMTCSARLPVYTLLIAAFIPQARYGWINAQGLVLFALYLSGIISAILAAAVMSLVARGQQRAATAMLLDLPRYKWPRGIDIVTGLRQRSVVFLRRAGGVVLLSSIFVWLLTALPPQSALTDSLAGRIGALIEPVLRPIGFNTEISIALIPGLLAREVAIGALAVVYGTHEAGLNSVLAADWSLATALSLLAWYVFAPQCLATFATMRRETNSWTMTLAAFAYLLVLAYTGAGIVFYIANAFGLS